MGTCLYTCRVEQSQRDVNNTTTKQKASTILPPLPSGETPQTICKRGREGITFLTPKRRHPWGRKHEALYREHENHKRRPCNVPDAEYAAKNSEAPCLKMHRRRFRARPQEPCRYRIGHIHGGWWDVALSCVIVAPGVGGAIVHALSCAESWTPFLYVERESESVLHVDAVCRSQCRAGGSAQHSQVDSRQ